MDDFSNITLNMYGIVHDSIVDGPGLRCSLFVQGCTHGCKACHNTESHTHGAGTDYSLAELYGIIVSNKLDKGVTFTGGDPFEQAKACAILAKKLKDNGYSIWAYTGYLYEDLLQGEGVKGKLDYEAARLFLQSIDVLVDGPFVLAKRSLLLKFRGSSNQRLIDVPKSMAAGSVVLWDDEAFYPQKPPSW